MTHSIREDGLSSDPGGEKSTGGDGRSGPDPVVGAGITLLGIFLMGTGGARDAHYVFDFGVLTALLGAGTFVVCVALSAMKDAEGLGDRRELGVLGGGRLAVDRRELREQAHHLDALAAVAQPLELAVAERQLVLAHAGELALEGRAHALGRVG